MQSGTAFSFCKKNSSQKSSYSLHKVRPFGKIMQNCEKVVKQLQLHHPSLYWDYDY